MAIVDAINKMGMSDAETIEDAVDILGTALLNVLKPAVGVAGKSPSATIFGYTVSDLQTDISLTGAQFTGTLKKQTSGALVDTWGEGYFLALDFSKINPNAGTIKVGLRPTQGSGLVELDSDMDGAFKITDPKKQVFVVKSDIAEQIFFLDSLVLEEE